MCSPQEHLIGNNPKIYSQKSVPLLLAIIHQLKFFVILLILFFKCIRSRCIHLPFKRKQLRATPVPSLYLTLRYLHRHEKVSRARSSSRTRGPLGIVPISQTRWGLSDIRNSSPVLPSGLKPAARPNWPQEVPGADFAHDAPAACKHWQMMRGARARTARALKPELLSLSGEVGARALEFHAPSREPRTRSREPRPERNRKRLCCPALPAAAGARGGGCTGRAAACGGEPGGQGRRAGTPAAPLELVPLPFVGQWLAARWTWPSAGRSSRLSPLPASRTHGELAARRPP